MSVPLWVFKLRRAFAAVSVLCSLSPGVRARPGGSTQVSGAYPPGATMPEETIDPGLLEQTKNQIRKLVAEIADLAESDIQPAEFYVEFLNRSVAAVAATGGALLADGRPGRAEAAIPGRVRLDRTDGRPGQDRPARRPAGLHAPGVAGPDHPAGRGDRWRPPGVQPDRVLADPRAR